jgi:drug/metabolite transporter (DMT)-like permease
MEKMPNTPRLTATLQALFAAFFFGLSAPLSKLLLGNINPLILAGLLYIGSGLGTLLFRSIQRIFLPTRQREAGLARPDWKWLAGAVLLGGIAAPIVLLFGLRATPAATASLLLNFEGVATTLIAFLLFKESIGPRVGWAVGLILLASILLSWNPGAGWGFTLGALGIIAACVFWGFDNNFTRQISAKDPLQIVTIKGLVAGSFSLLLGLLTGSPLPQLPFILAGLLLGAISYGMSIVLFVYAMRGLGAARTSTLFGLAPFVGAGLSLILFRESISWFFLASIPFMAVGAWLLMGESHAHAHLHPALEHEHRHSHSDGHHDHLHTEPLANPKASHSHLHTHPELDHSHPHSPDIHHRHTHPK